MRKVFGQVNIAIVCAVLGFMLTYYFRSSGIIGSISAAPQSSTELAQEVDNLKKQISDINKNNDEIQQKVKDYEKAAANLNTPLKNEMDRLNEARVDLGLTEVQGPGITVKITPKTTAIVNNVIENTISHSEIISIINEMVAAGAEAVSVNDKRITQQSGIKISSGNSYILINGEKVSPKSKIEIKFIGDKNALYKAWEKVNLLDFRCAPDYDFKAEKSDNLKLPAFSKSYYSDYIREDK